MQLLPSYVLFGELEVERSRPRELRLRDHAVPVQAGSEGAVPSSEQMRR